MATLSAGSAASIRGTLFQIPTLLGFSLQSFTPSGESKRRFPSLLSALALSWVTSRASHRCSSGFFLPKKPCPYLRPHGLGEVRTSCSLGLMDLSGFLSDDACTKMSLLCAAPLVLMSLSSHENSDPEPQGVGPSSDRHLPSKRVPARMAFLTICVRYLLGRSARRGLFFPLGGKKILTSLPYSLFATNRLPPNGR